MNGKRRGGGSAFFFGKGRVGKSKRVALPLVKVLWNGAKSHSDAAAKAQIIFGGDQSLLLRRIFRPLLLLPLV